MGAESELELVLDTRVRLTFFLLHCFGAEACELSESELLESLPDDEEDELLSLLLLELVSSELLTCFIKKQIINTKNKPTTIT